MTIREQELTDALRFVQRALANWRDGEDIIHPKHGILNLEEVKYLVVDTVLETDLSCDDCKKCGETTCGNDINMRCFEPIQ